MPTNLPFTLRIRRQSKRQRKPNSMPRPCRPSIPAATSFGIGTSFAAIHQIRTFQRVCPDNADLRFRFTGKTSTSLFGVTKTTLTPFKPGFPDAALGGTPSTQTFVITVTDENDAPTISTTPLNINEPCEPMHERLISVNMPPMRTKPTHLVHARTP